MSLGLSSCHVQTDLYTTRLAHLTTGSFASGSKWILYKSTEHDISKCSVCMYDEHELDPDQPPIGIPIEYDKRTCRFTVWGKFCSFHCIRRYLLDSKRLDANRVMPLLTMYMIRVLGKYEPIEPAPRKELLQRYGGPLSIDEFRHDSIQGNKKWNTRWIGVKQLQVVYDNYLLNRSAKVFNKAQSKATSATSAPFTAPPNIPAATRPVPSIPKERSTADSIVPRKQPTHHIHCSLLRLMTKN